MFIHFYIRYHTNPGQSLFISGNNDMLGNNDAAKAVDLSYFDNDHWHVKIEFPQGFDDTVLYKYFLKDIDGSEIYDGEENRSIDISVINKDAITVYDTWNAAGDVGNVFFTRAFNKVLLNAVTKIKIAAPQKRTHIFRVKAPLLQPGEIICLCGSTENLKNWSVSEPLLLKPENDWFVVSVAMDENEWPASYKYGIYNTEEKSCCALKKVKTAAFKKVNLILGW